MNLDIRNGIDTIKNGGVEKKINSLMNEIENEYKFKGNTLENLFSFKLGKAKQEVILNSGTFKDDLIKEIGDKALSGDIKKNNNEELSFAEYGALANKIIEVSELTNEIQKGIQKLRAELLNANFNDTFLSSNSLLTKRFYSPETLTRIDNPKNISDNLLGFGIGLGESLAFLGKFGYDLVKGIGLAPYHFIQIIRGKAEYDGNINI